MGEIILKLKGFLEFICQTVQNVYILVSSLIISVVLYLVGYPEKQQVLALMLVMFCFDILTRIIAISKESHGFFRAIFITKKLTSRKFINGVLLKIFEYIIILSIAYMITLPNEFSLIGNSVAVVLYVVLFFYEFISILENLRDAGSKLVEPLLAWAKRKQIKILDEDIESTESVENIEETISQ